MADVGTAFEVGFMRALGKPVFAYTNSARGYFERLTEDFYEGKATRQSDGYIRGPDGMMVENHGMVDNLMLDASVDESGGVLIRRDVPSGDLYNDVAAFEECLIEAKRRLG
jgi:nucleoside 2-deoxyribosyltransferase